jgi:hypothetical protein
MTSLIFFCRISEKQQLLTVPDLGENMAAVQGLLKKHDAFETDLSVHNGCCNEIVGAGQKLIDDGNHHADNIVQRCEQVRIILLQVLMFQVNILCNEKLICHGSFKTRCTTSEFWLIGVRATFWTTLPICNSCGRLTSWSHGLLTRSHTLDQLSMDVTCLQFRHY